MPYEPRDIDEIEKEEKDDDLEPTTKKSSLAGKIAACALGLVVGFAGGIAGFFGAGYFAVSQPIGSTVEMIAPYVPLDVDSLLFGENGYLNKDYKTQKILTILKDVLSAAKGLASGKSTLSSFSKISPKVEKTVNDMLVEPIKAKGIPIDTETLMSKPLKAQKEGEQDLMTYVMDCFYDATLISLHGYKEGEVLDDPVMMALCYGKKDVDYKIEDGVVKMQGDAKPATLKKLTGEEGISGMRLVDIMDADPNNALMMYVLYGKKGIHYTLSASNAIEPCQKRLALLGSNVYNEYGEPLSGGTLDGLTYTYKDNGGTVKLTEYPGITVATADGDAQVYLLSDEQGNALMYEPRLLNELTGNSPVLANITSRLTIGEVMDETDVQENIFLKHVADTTIADLPEAIEKLEIAEVFADTVYLTYKLDEPYVDINGKTVNKGDFIRETTNSTGDTVYVLAQSDDERQLDSIWKYLLTKNGVEQDYTVTQMGEMVTNVKANVNNATINSLRKDGLVDGLSDSVADGEVKATFYGVSLESQLTANDIPYGLKADGTKYTLGDLTVTQMMKYMSVVLSIS